MRMRMIKQNPCLHLQNKCWWIFKIRREERKQTICIHLDAPGNRRSRQFYDGQNTFQCKSESYKKLKEMGAQFPHYVIGRLFAPLTLNSTASLYRNNLEQLSIHVCR